MLIYRRDRKRVCFMDQQYNIVVQRHSNSGALTRRVFRIVFFPLDEVRPDAGYTNN